MSTIARSIAIPLIILSESKNPTNASRQYDLKLGPGTKKSAIIADALLTLEKGFMRSMRKHIDTVHAEQQFESIFARTGRFDKFCELTMYPISDTATITPRFPSNIAQSIERSPVDHKGNILISTDLALASLSSAFLKVLRADISSFASNNWTDMSRKVRLGDVDSTSDIELGFGELYKTGLVKVTFDDDINIKDLKEHLLGAGYEIGGDRPPEKDEEVLQVEQFEPHMSSKDNEQNDDSIAGVAPQEASPLLKTKKALVINAIDKLESALDEFMTVFKGNESYDISELSGAFESLTTKLNDSGLIGKSTEK
jgi:hypothetical protein